ncbi:hypothetical protein PGT21_023183 [Puccinia graminis f. sp. tritici]|uniref:Uncharacterized protein n=1 Tax=Puccinia graminis f. sp. tritici TaxID=56615 RepID=A0A5B0QU35_PUCGR|nr:hypothetical protein PGT21_023183 [Puccinia graminis f. sp. tritici]
MVPGPEAIVTDSRVDAWCSGAAHPNDLTDIWIGVPGPMALLRKFPTLEAREVITLTNVFIRELPIRHPFKSHILDK